MEKYYALVENERIVYLGEFDSMEEADNSSEEMIIWIMTEDNLKQLRVDISKVLPTQSMSIFLSEYDIELFKDIVYNESTVEWTPTTDDGTAINVAFEASDGEDDDAK